ncbi:oocyte zinc finger protein XlCOF29-like [Phyllobates terribilis]|uniref:oocyte zinc finger protein XlCOF29-like n=1 Tax=Phyllobates terribilis TaxID=111132 RepID=UPI003CCB3DA5
MDKEQNEITKRLLNFTFEMIYLLTGEDYTIIKKTSGDCVTPSSRPYESGGRIRSRGPITESPPHAPIHERNNRKILELANKIIELLTREVPIRCQDITVYFSVEEWEYLEGHKDLYEDVMMENDQRPSSQDGSSRRNPPERCPRLLYSQKRPEEKQNVPENHQDENLNDIKVVVIEEDEEMEDDQPYGFPSERCPRPLYPQDSREEDHNVPGNQQRLHHI